MPQFKVMKDRVFGEGWAAGTIINMDWPAAKDRVEKGDLEYLCEDEDKPIVVEEPTEAEQRHEVMVKNLKDAKTVLDRLKVKFWLTCGTALGALREEDFIGHDPDIDLGVLAEDEDKADKIIASMKRKGFELMYEWGQRGSGYELSFVRDDIKLDIFFFYKKGAKRWHGVYWRNENFPYAFPAKLIETHKKIKFQGLILNVYKDLEKYAELHYGKDWVEPKERWNYWEDPKCIDKRVL